MDRSGATASAGEVFQIPANYDFSKSSELNYCSENAEFVGKYRDIRSQLDYSYHKYYNVDRQLLHDKLIDRFLRTKVHDREANMECEVPLENWIVFTAGPMGAGKGHTMQWLAKEELFPVDAFVNVDPDLIRHLLPETSRYNEIDNNSTGYFTQKEVNYISEVLSYHSLLRGKNVLVDGSLRNAHWYLEYFKNLREKFPIIKIAILHVTAKPETVLKRARNRAKVTGRYVPEVTILESMRTIPESLAVLCPHAEFSATFANEDNEIEPRLLFCTMQDRVRESSLPSTSSDQCLASGADSLTLAGSSSANTNENTSHYSAPSGPCKNEAKMHFSWSLRAKDNIPAECESGPRVCVSDSKANSGSAEKKQGEGDAVLLERKRKAESESEAETEYSYPRTSTTAVTAAGEVRVSSNFSLLSPMRSAANSNINDGSEATVLSVSTTVRSSEEEDLGREKVDRYPDAYLLSSPQGTVPLDTWKSMFAAIWEMKCALPDVLQTPRDPNPAPAPVLAPVAYIAQSTNTDSTKAST